MQINRLKSLDIDICPDHDCGFDNVELDIYNNALRISLFKDGHYKMQVTIDLDTYEVWHD